jgi:hypothetical protein
LIPLFFPSLFGSYVCVCVRCVCCVARVYHLFCFYMSQLPLPIDVEERLFRGKCETEWLHPIL